MSAREARNEVVVVDIDWPFWSMVRFMVKWAIAAIPAILLLVFIGAGATASVSLIASGFHRLVESTSTAPPVPHEASVPIPVPSGLTPTEQSCAQTRNPAQCMEQERRCAGREHDKCMAEERRAATETPEEKAARARRLDEEREQNMRKVR